MELSSWQLGTASLEVSVFRAPSAVDVSTSKNPVKTTRRPVSAAASEDLLDRKVAIYRRHDDTTIPVCNRIYFLLTGNFEYYYPHVRILRGQKHTFAIQSQLGEQSLSRTTRPQFVKFKSPVGQTMASRV